MDKVVAIQIGGWLACLFFSVGGANQLMKFWKNLKGEAPAPANSQLEQGQVELERRVAAAETDLRMLHATREADRAAVEVSARARSGKIYDKIDEVSKEMRRGFSDMERSIGRLEGKTGERTE